MLPLSISMAYEKARGVMYGFGGVMYGFDRMMYGLGGSDVHFLTRRSGVIRNCLFPGLRANLTKTSGPKYEIMTNARHGEICQNRPE